MKSVVHFLNKAIVVDFYRQNAGFFLILALALFGIVRPADFILSPQLLAEIVRYPAVLGALLALTSLYQIKCLFFIQRTISLPEYRCLDTLNVLSLKKRVWAWAGVYFGLSAPVAAYMGYVALYAVGQNEWLSLAALVVYQVLWAVIFIGLALYQLAQPEREGVLNRYLQRYYRLPKNLTIVYLYGLTYNRFVLTLLLKAASLAAYWGAFNLYDPAAGDLRPAMLLVLVGTAPHLALLVHFQRFDAAYLFALRNLPLSLRQRFARYALAFALLLVPEMALALGKAGESGAYWLALNAVGFSLGFLALYFGALYAYANNAEGFMKFCYASLLALFFAILCYAPILLLGGLMFGFGFLAFQRNYWQYEPQVSG